MNAIESELLSKRAKSGTKRPSGADNDTPMGGKL
jgi:hypothetical protein